MVIAKKVHGDLMVNDCIVHLYEHLVHVSFLSRLSDTKSDIKQGEKNNMTIILISHDLDVIKKCDEVLHFLDGRVVKHSNMTSFLKNLSQNK